MAADAIIFFGPRNSAMDKPPFWTNNTSKRVFWLKDVLSVVQKDKFIFHFSPLKSPKPPFLGTFNAFPMKNKNANNFWADSPIIMKFGMQSLWPTPKSAICSKIKKLKIQDGRRRHYFLCSSGSRPGQTRGSILASDTSKRVFWHKDVPSGVSKDKNFSFHLQNRQKPQFLGTFNAFPMENQNANNI